MQDLKTELANIFFILKEKRQLSEFYRKTLIKKHYKSRYSFIRAINNFSFSIVEREVKKSIEKMKLIISEYFNFLETANI